MSKLKHVKVMHILDAPLPTTCTRVLKHKRFEGVQTGRELTKVMSDLIPDVLAGRLTDKDAVTVHDQSGRAIQALERIFGAKVTQN
jgi:hypothetical protein